MPFAGFKLNWNLYSADWEWDYCLYNWWNNVIYDSRWSNEWYLAVWNPSHNASSLYSVRFFKDT